LTIDHTENDKPVIAAAVIPIIGKNRAALSDSREEETEGLILALDAECAFVQTLFVRAVNPAQLFGTGQLEAISEKLKAAECSLFVVDGHLSPVQQRNLEKFLGVKVIDRTGLILEIFGLRARTKAGRLQVETARLAYERTRLVRTWTHLERQRGGSGFISGPGETQIEADRRMLDEALLRLKAQLKEVEKTRRIQREGRTSRNVPIVALVGYTNAGKSTLFNNLTEAHVFAKDMPFATLDPTIRQMKLNSGTDIALVDTVGFITDLPTSLIESFKATLEETVLADVIIHVHDASSVDVFNQDEEVHKILDDLEDMMDHDLPPIIHVWNKTDLLTADERDTLTSAQETLHPDDPHLLISALSGDGLETLRNAISDVLARHHSNVTVRVDETDGQLLSWLYAHGKVLNREDLPESGLIELTLQMSSRTIGQMNRKFPNVITEE
tara:strand:- start:15781 stop:17106 length:1326 start_codon:yes stop_codon:yes gene_type:complete